MKSPTPSSPPPPATLRHTPLQKQRSWSPEIEYVESWQRRKSLSLARRNRRSMSVTDEDIEELRGFLDLGMVFDEGCPNGRLSEALPALDLYFAVRRAFLPPMVAEGLSAAGSVSSSDASPAESPLSIFSISPSESEEVRQAGIKRWARLVALAARDSY